MQSSKSSTANRPACARTTEVQVTISTPLADLRIAGKEMLDVLVDSGTDPGDEFDLQIIGRGTTGVGELKIPYSKGASSV